MNEYPVGKHSELGMEAEAIDGGRKGTRAKGSQHLLYQPHRELLFCP